MRTTSLLGLAFLPAAIACGSAPENSSDSDTFGRQSSAIQDGTSDTQTTHNFAVGIATRAGAVCSGTLIAPNLVLTARHCVVPPGETEAVTCADTFPAKNIDPSTLFVTTEPSLRRAKKFYVAKEITTPSDTSFCGNDIALVTLEKNIAATEAQPATPVVQFSMTDRSKIGGKIAALGYGITNPSATDSGVRRIHEDISIECVPGDTTYACKGTYKSMVDSDREFVTEGYVCSGDSGSGAFDQDSFSSGSPFVMGALSRGPQTQDRCLAAIYSRTDAHVDLIVAAGKKAAESGGYDAPAWVSPPVEPSTVDPSPTPECADETCSDTAPTEPAPDAPATAMARKTTSGCSAAPSASSSEGSFGALALAGALGLVIGRRRRAA